MGMINRVLVPFFIIALPISAILAIILYYHHNKAQKPLPPEQPRTQVLSQAAAFGSRQWPVFRGDAAFTGVTEGTLADSFDLAWRFETRGPVKSTPVVANGIAYFSSTDSYLYAADIKTGHEKWWFKANDALEASPLYADGKLFVASDFGTFYAVNAEDGLVVWTFDAKNKILGSANSYVDAATGKRRIVFGGYDNCLYSLDAEDGTLIWKMEARSYINGAPAVAGGTAVFGSCDGNLYLVPLDDPNGTQTIDIESYMAASPAIADGVIYAGNYEGLFIAASLTSREVVWQFRRKDVPFLSSPAVTADRVLFGARDNNLYCLNRSDGAVVWTFASTASIDSSPVVCGDRVVFGSDNGRLYIVDLADGKEIFAYTLGKPVTAGPAIAENTILVGCEDGAVYAFRPAQPAISP